MKVRLTVGKKLPNRTIYYPGVYNVPDKIGREWVTTGCAVPIIGSPPPKVAEPPDTTLQSTPEPEPEPPEADDQTPQED